MEINGIQIDDRVLAAARQRFEKSLWASPGRLWSLDFDKSLALYSDESNSFEAIGRSAGGLTRERARGVYNNYFKPVLPGARTGNERREISFLKRREARALRALPENPFFGELVERLREKKLSVSQVPIVGKGTDFGNRRSIINGKLCQFHFAGHIFPNCRVSLSHVCISIIRCKDVQYLIFVQRVPGFKPMDFFVPTQAILDEYWDGKRSLFWVYIPLRRRARRNARLDFWKYANAWRSLR